MSNQYNRILIIAISLQLIMVGSICLTILKIDIPLLRSLVGFIYLIFIPGVLILSLFRVQTKSFAFFILYSIGLSLTALMLFGLFINTLYPKLGLSRPLSLLYLMPFIVIMITLNIFLYVKNERAKEDFNPIFAKYSLKTLNLPPLLLLIFLPILAIAGAINVTLNDSPFFIYLLIALILLILLLLIFTDKYSEDSYPLVVFFISIALLYHTSLVSNYIWGWDIFLEYRLANNVILDSVWNPDIPQNANGMLSIVILAPIFSIISDTNLTWVFKVFYPFLFSFVPVSLYYIYRSQLPEKIAFLSCFFFVSQFMFFQEMISLARQQIAELFLVLMIILLLDNDIDKMWKKVIFVLFGFSLVVSHYGLTYLFIFYLLAMFFILYIKDYIFSNYNKKLIQVLSIQDNWLSTAGNYRRFINLRFILLIVLITLFWYIYTTGSSAFSTIIVMFNNIYSKFFIDLFNPDVTQGLEIIVKPSGSPMRDTAKFLHIFAQFLILLGVMIAFFFGKRFKFNEEYFALSIGNFIVCSLGIILPYFAGALNASRLYQISLIFLSPFCIIGFQKFISLISDIINKFISIPHLSCFKLFAFFLSIFLVFNSGMIYELANEQSSSFSFNPLAFRYFFEHECDLYGSRWLENTVKSGSIYGDYFGTLSLVAYSNLPLDNLYKIYPWILIPSDSYIYVRSGDVLFSEKNSTNLYHSIYVNKFINGAQKLYNDGCEVYRV